MGHLINELRDALGATASHASWDQMLDDVRERGQQLGRVEELRQALGANDLPTWSQMLVDVQWLKREQAGRDQRLDDTRQMLETARHDRDRMRQALHHVARHRGTAGPLNEVAMTAYDDAEQELRETLAELIELRVKWDRFAGHEAPDRQEPRARQISDALCIEDESTTKQVAAIEAMADRADKLADELSTLRQRYANGSLPVAPSPALCQRVAELEASTPLETRARVDRLEQRVRFLEKA